MALAKTPVFHYESYRYRTTLWNGTHTVISPLRAFISPLALPALPK